jgi:four helix bundle protein
MMRDFRSLDVWLKSHQLTLVIYKNIPAFPKAEQYGLTSQVCRAAVSIPTNIAEGCGRGSNAELSRFMQIAMGSASELEYELLLANELGWLPSESYQQLNEQVLEVKRMLAAYIGKIRASKG